MQPDASDVTPTEPPFLSGVTEPRPQNPFWGYQDLALVIGLLFAFIALILVIAGGSLFLYPKLRDNQAPLLLPTQVALYVAVYLSLRIVLGLRHGKPVFSSLGWCRSKFHLGIAVVAGIVLAFIVSGLATLLHTPKVPSPVESLMESPVLLALFGVMAVTVAPFFEELFFRGFIQPLFSRTLGVIAGVILTAALFGALHAPEYSFAWQYALAVSIVGAVLGWVRVRSNSIIPSTVMHGAYNAVFVVALALSKLTANK
jgi:uncharacterized protein